MVARSRDVELQSLMSARMGAGDLKGAAKAASAFRNEFPNNPPGLYFG